MASVFSLPVNKRHRRGRVEPDNIVNLRALSHHRHHARLKALRAVTPPAALDWRTATPLFIPLLEETDDDQSQCGSCWCFSGTEVVESALMKSGVLTLTQRLSKEYTLDCGKNGGCGGDDNTTVLDGAKTDGLPLSSVYGPYTAGNGDPGTCRYVASMALYKIADWGFADSNGGQGVTSTADIKAAIMAYGMVGCAVAAGDDWDSVGPGTTITGTSTSIDHDVALVGWDDNHDNGDGSKGAWIMRNSWGPSWGGSGPVGSQPDGYCWIKYGADSIGTETVFAIGSTTPTPVPPSPPGPTPIPPVCQNVLVSSVTIPTGTTNIPGVGTLTMCAQVPPGSYDVTFTPTVPPPPPAAPITISTADVTALAKVVQDLGTVVAQGSSTISAADAALVQQVAADLAQQKKRRESNSET